MYATIVSELAIMTALAVDATFTTSRVLAMLKSITVIAPHGSNSKGNLIECGGSGSYSAISSFAVGIFILHLAIKTSSNCAITKAFAL